MKDNYVITINDFQNRKKFNKYTYSFGRTEIEFYICKNCSYITFMQSSKRNQQTISEGKDTLYVDFVKKAMLIHQILYSEPIDFKELKVLKNKNILYEISENPLYSLLGNKKTIFSKEWKNLIQVILNSTLSRGGETDALIKNAVMAKSEDKQSFRFMYNWMAMNGIYKRITKIAKENYSKINKSFDKDQLTRDSTQIKLLARLYFGKNVFINDNIKNKIFNTSRRVLDDIDIEKSKEELDYKLLNNKDNILNIELKKLNLGDGEGYTCGCFILLWLPYYIRCNYFHSEIALPIYAFKNENILKVLEIVNIIIEGFLDENIPIWCVDNIGDEYLEKLKNVVNNWG